LGELTFLAGIFIQNNVNSTYPLKNIAMQEFGPKLRENTSSSPRHKTPTNHEKAQGLIDPHDSLKSKKIHS
jgi:hypothetical protein